jgi:hypothetical protein
MLFSVTAVSSYSDYCVVLNSGLYCFSNFTTTNQINSLNSSINLINSNIQVINDSSNLALANIVTVNTTLNTVSTKVDNINTSGNIKNLGFNISSELKSWFDLLYYSITNPVGFINETYANTKYYLIGNGNNLATNISDVRSALVNTNTTTNLALANIGTVNTTANLAIANIGTVNNTAIGKASPGNCAAGTVVMNTTTSGVQCIAVSGGSFTPGQDINASLNWTYLQNYPAASADGYAITALDDTLTTGRFIKGTGDNVTGDFGITGNVGIGTTTPDALLEVESNNFPVGKFTRTTDVTGGSLDGLIGIASGYQLRTVTSADMIDGFGGGILLSGQDNTSSSTETQGVFTRLYARRDGSDTAGLFQIFTKGTNADEPTITFRATGNVGIGTTSPESQLDIRSVGTGNGAGTLTLSTADTIVVGTNVLGQINFSAPEETTGGDSNLLAASIYAVATDSFTLSANPTDLVFATAASEAATEKMRITSAGNVGIGTTNPTGRLHINSTGTTTRETKDIVISGTLSAINAGRCLVYTHPSGNSMANICMTTDASGNQGELALSTAVSTATNTTEAIRIDNSQQVGIGTTIPRAKLDVIADGNGITGRRYAGGVAFYSYRAQGNETNPTIMTGNTEIGRFAMVPYNGSGYFGGAATVGITNNEALNETSMPTYLYWLTTPTGSVTATEKMRLTSDGKLGINITSPTYQLDVTGDIRSSAVIRAGTGVIQSAGDYNLASATGRILLGTSSGTGALWFGAVNTNDWYIQSLANKDLTFVQNGVKTGMILKNSTGFVGINTASPQQTLNVNGTMNVTGAVTLENTKCGAGNVLTTSATGLVSCVADATGSGGSSTKDYTLFNTQKLIYDEFCGIKTTTGYPFYGTAIGSGTTTAGTGNEFHPCTNTFSSSATASSGYAINTGASQFRLKENMTFEAIFYKNSKAGNVSHMFIGFVDSVTAGQPVDGVYFNISNATVTPYNTNNSVNSNGLNTFNITLDTWYRAKIIITNITHTQFFLYNSTSNTGTGNTDLVMQQNISGRVPSIAGRETGAGFSTWVQGATTAVVLLNMDYMSILYNQTVYR